MTMPTPPTTNWRMPWQEREAIERAYIETELKPWLIEEVRQLSASKVTATFSGGSDEGGIDEVTLTRLLADGEEIELECPDDLLAGLEYIVDTNFGFDGTPHIAGSVVVDAVAGTLTAPYELEVWTEQEPITW